MTNCKFCKEDLDGWTTLGLSFHPQCFEFVAMNGMIRPRAFGEMVLKDYWENYPNGWTEHDV